MELKLFSERWQNRNKNEAWIRNYNRIGTKIPEPKSSFFYTTYYSGIGTKIIKELEMESELNLFKNEEWNWNWN